MKKARLVSETPLYTRQKITSRLIAYTKKRAVCNLLITNGSCDMAERVRFELTVLAYTRFPGVHLKPLGHLSTMVPISSDYPGD